MTERTLTARGVLLWRSGVVVGCASMVKFCERDTQWTRASVGNKARSGKISTRRRMIWNSQVNGDRLRGKKKNLVVARRNWRGVS